MTLKPLAALTLTAWLGACAIIPPDSQVALHDASRATLPGGTTLTGTHWPEAGWWHRYQDPQLDTLVAAALKDNPGMALAAARLKQAEARLAGVEASDGVNLVLGGNATRQLYPEHDIYPPPLGGTWRNNGKVQLSATWDVDWWGRNRAAISAAVGEREASRADQAAATQSLASSVAQSYFSWLGDEARLSVVKRQADVVAAQLAVTTRRVAAGLESSSALEAGREDLAGVRAALAALDANCRRDREALRALVGGDATLVAGLQARDLPAAAAAMPTSLGLTLLARRPDLVAARWRVESSISSTRADEAAFYPDINLSAFFGFSSIGLDNLLEASSRNPGISAAFTLPIFDSGRLKSRLGVSRSQRDAAVAQYNQTLLNAVQEVADQGLALQGLLQQKRQQTLALEAARAQQQAVSRRHASGIADRQTLLRAELPVLKENDQLLQVNKALLLSDVALTKALGGGYQAPATAR